jgi:pseudaminic acid cytidylyltransferase
MQESKVAIITARGGSKRIPKKNIKLFFGRPIIDYSIQAALESELFDEVMVSTDDHQIAECAVKAGAKVPFLRSEENSNDVASTADVICEVLKSYHLINKFYNIGCCIYPTAPFINPDLLKKGYQLFRNKKFDVVFPVIQFSYPIQRSIRIIDGEKALIQWPENYLKRSQDLEPIYHDVGQFYWFNSDALLRKKTLNIDNSGVIIIKELMAQDIDNEEDWKLAELKYSLLNKCNK